MMNKDMVYILNPAYTLRNDVHRVALYSNNHQNTELKNWISFIHPFHAILLSFFTHKRTLEENILLISEFLKKDYEYTYNKISPFINNSDTLIFSEKNVTIKFPPNLIIKHSEINSNYKFEEYQIEDFVCKEVDLKTKRFYTGPQILTIMLNNKCVTKCKYCYADIHTTYKAGLSTSRILEIIDEAAALKIKSILLIGGEIFLHKDWHIILKKLVEYGMCPDFISTKHPLTRDIIDKLTEAKYYNPIQISLDACSSSILSESLHVKENYLLKMQEGLKLIDKSDLNYHVATILTSYNKDIDEIKKIFFFLKKLENIKAWNVSPATNSIYIDPNVFAQLKLKRKEVEAIYSNIKEEMLPNTHFDIRMNLPATNRKYYTCETGSNDFSGPACSALNYHMFVLPDGKVTICEQLYWLPQFIIGDLQNENIKEVWNSPQALYLSNLKNTDIQVNSTCKACELQIECYARRNRCWSDIIKAYGRENWDYPDPRCAKAPKMLYTLEYE